MSAPVIDENASTEGIPENAVPIRLPVMVIEGMETSDRRYIEPGTLRTRSLPIPLYAATRATHGNEGDAATWHVGAITHAERVPGPEVLDMDGNPLPDGTFAWVGTGWMYTDVPAAPQKSAYQLVKDRALRGNSVDMTEVTAEYQDAQGQLADEGTYVRISMQSGVISATTLVGIPAFAGAYIELDGERMATEEPLVAAADRSPAWLAAELGDSCSPCAAGDDMPEPSAEALTAASGDDFDPPERDYSTSGMVALVPANPNMLLVPGGDPANELHLTLAYLGDRIDEWEPEQIAAVHQVARRLTDADYEHELRMAEAAERGETLDPDLRPYVSEAQKGPLEGHIFAHSVFNPNTDEPATVYLLDGTGDRPAIEYLASNVQMDVQREVGDVLFPRQHSPFLPHITAGWGLDPSQLTYTGPVLFDRIRVAIGDDVVDYPLGGGEAALVASAATLPPVDIFTDPQLPGPTPHTVEDTGAPWGDRVYGHLAAWDSCHTGMPGRCVTPPRSASGYAYFMVHATRALGSDGEPVTVPVGYGTISRAPGVGGHADIHLSARETAAHYDNTCTAVFEIAVGEDQHGIWYSGRLIPGLDAETRRKAIGAVFSGDWRPIRGHRELMAALAVNTPGFPVRRALVASGVPGALVAAGTVPQPPAAAGDAKAALDTDTVVEGFAEILAWVRGQRLTAEHARIAAGLAEALEGIEPVDPAEQMFAVEVEMLLATDGDHPWFADDTMDDALTAAGRKKLHLPSYIKRIAKHLKAKGMAQGHAIASAVNAAKKMCATGDLNFPGHQDVNPGSRAEACAAVAQWKKDRPGAR